MSKNRIVIIGIDGGTFDIIRPLVEQGQLPHLASLLAGGVQSDLRSTVPPITAPAWTSFMTGTSPGKHGIFNFVGDTHKTYHGRVFSAADSRSPSLWSLLGRAGKRLMLINIPFTYPPEEVNGVMLSGMGAPEGSEAIAHPCSVYRELQAKFGGYKVDHHVGEVYRDPAKVRSRADDLIRSLHAMETKRTDAALHLLDSHDWDLFMIVYVITDRLQHLFWKFMDTSHPGHDPALAERYRQAIADGYRRADEEMGRIMERIGKDVTFIVMSDHGFGPLHKSFYINCWLREQGFLKLRRRLPWKFRVAPVSVGRILGKLRLGALSALLPEEVRERSIPLIRRAARTWDEFVDWGRTRLYAADPLGVSVNLRGREPGGIVEAGEVEALLSEVRTKLRALQDPDTGQPVVDEIIRNVDAYSGPAASDAPDLLISLKGLSYLPYPQRFRAKQLFAPPTNEWSGTHRYNGIFIMRGPQVRQGLSFSGAGITDIAPTVLQVFGQPIPAAMDGRVLEEVFDPQELAAHPVTYARGAAGERNARGTFSDGDEQKVRTHLESLGYL